jgi:hypothetical protein
MQDVGSAARNLGPMLMGYAVLRGRRAGGA